MNILGKTFEWEEVSVENKIEYVIIIPGFVKCVVYPSGSYQYRYTTYFIDDNDIQTLHCTVDYDDAKICKSAAIVDIISYIDSISDFYNLSVCLEV